MKEPWIPDEPTMNPRFVRAAMWAVVRCWSFCSCWSSA